VLPILYPPNYQNDWRQAMDEQSEIQSFIQGMP
jgi:hypothetical protein